MRSHAACTGLQPSGLQLVAGAVPSGNLPAPAQTQMWQEMSHSACSNQHLCKTGVSGGYWAMTPSLGAVFCFCLFCWVLGPAWLQINTHCRQCCTAAGLFWHKVGRVCNACSQGMAHAAVKTAHLGEKACEQPAHCMPALLFSFKACHIKAVHPQNLQI